MHILILLDPILNSHLQWTAVCNGPTLRISHCVSVIVYIHVVLFGNLAAEPSGKHLKTVKSYSDGCKRGLVTVDVFNIFMHIHTDYSSNTDPVKNFSAHCQCCWT